MSQCNTTFDLKINLGHSDLYSTVQWFLSFILCSEKHFSFIGKAWFRRATTFCDSSYYLTKSHQKQGCPSVAFTQKFANRLSKNATLPWNIKHENNKLKLLFKCIFLLWYSAMSVSQIQINKVADNKGAISTKVSKSFTFNIANPPNLWASLHKKKKSKCGKPFSFKIYQLNISTW